MEGNQLIILLGFQVIIVIGLIVLYSTRIKRVGPNEALIVSGRSGQPARISDDGYPFRVVVGGRSFIWPLVETSSVVSLEPFGESFSFGRLKTADSSQVTVRGKVQFHIKNDLPSVRKAASYFLSKSEKEKGQIVMGLFESELRRLVEGTNKEDILEKPMGFGDKVVETAEPKMNEMGIVILSLIIEDVR